MPRPNSISRLHELKYELRRPRLKAHEIVRLQSEYEALIEQVCQEYRCIKPELLKVLARDFGKWVNDEKLPWIEEEER